MEGSRLLIPDMLALLLWEPWVSRMEPPPFWAARSLSSLLCTTGTHADGEAAAVALPSDCMAKGGPHASSKTWVVQSLCSLGVQDAC